MSVLVGGANYLPWPVGNDIEDPLSRLSDPAPVCLSALATLVLKSDARLGEIGTEVAHPVFVSALYGDISADIGCMDAPVWIFPPPRGGGANSRLGFNGFTRDASGGVIPGVTAKLFLTATDVKQSETVSGADGSFIVSTAEAGSHFLVFYKSGTPDISGTTVNTLIGS